MFRRPVSGIILTLLLASILTLAFNTQPVISAGPALEWIRTYRGPNGGCARDAIQTCDGGYALVGFANSYSTGDTSFWLVKTDPDGNKQWDKTYGEAEEYGDAYSVIQTADGGYVIAGESARDGESTFAKLMKVDAEGNQQWARYYDGYPHSVIPTSDGGYAMAGYANSPSPGPSPADFWLTKVDSNGNMQWSKTYGGTDAEVVLWAKCLVQTSDGGYAMGGFTHSFGAGGYDFWLVKVDTNGNKQWDKTYGGAGDDFAWCCAQTSDGGYAMGGDGFANLVKVDAEGNQQWVSSLGIAARCMIQTSDGGYTLAGFVGLVKTDASGNIEWSESFAGTPFDGGFSVIQTSDGGYAVAGRAGTDAVLLKTASYQEPDFEISVSPESRIVQVGDSIAYQVSLNSKNGFGGDVSLSAVQTPAGDLSFSFNPQDVVLSPNGAVESVLTVTTTMSTPLESFTITVTATGEGITKQSTVFVSVEVGLDVPYQNQGDTGWCGPTSLAMVLRYYGINFHSWDYTDPYTNQPMPEMPIVTIGCLNDYVFNHYSWLTPVLGSYSSAEEKNANIVEDVKSNLTAGYPVILRLAQPAKGHFIVITGFNDSGTYVNDPSGAVFSPDYLNLPGNPSYHGFLTWQNWDELKMFIPFGNTIPWLESTTLIIRGDSPQPLGATAYFTNLYGSRIDFESPSVPDKYHYVDLDYGLTWKLHYSLLGNDEENNIITPEYSTFWAYFSLSNTWSSGVSLTLNTMIIGEDGSHHPLADSTVVVQGFQEGLCLVTATDFVLEKTQYYHILCRLWDSDGYLVDSFATPNFYYLNLGIEFSLVEQQHHLFLHAYDTQGNHVGLNYTTSQVDLSIPGSYYYDDENGTVTMVIPQAMNLTVVIDAKYAEEPVESYNLTATLNANAGSFTETHSENITKKTNQAFFAHVSETNVTLYKLPGVAITNVTASKTIVGAGYSVEVTVTVVNTGDSNETFPIVLLGNNTTKLNQTEVTLMGGATETFVMEWNNSSLAKGNYTISACASPVPEEADTADNNCTCTFQIHVGIPGDVSGPTQGVYDGTTNMRDINYLIQLFNTNPSSPNWKPNADINNDGTVNMRDIQIAILNFNKH